MSKKYVDKCTCSSFQRIYNGECSCGYEYRKNFRLRNDKFKKMCEKCNNHDCAMRDGKVTVFQPEIDSIVFSYNDGDPETILSYKCAGFKKEL